VLDDRPDGFDDHNLFLHGLLGIVSATRRLEAAVRPASAVDAPVPADDPWLLFVLGLVAFSGRLRAHLDAVEAPPAPPPPRAGEGATPLSGLLR
jgi:hypothetical protein